MATYFIKSSSSSRSARVAQTFVGAASALTLTLAPALSSAVASSGLEAVEEPLSLGVGSPKPVPKQRTNIPTPKPRRRIGSDAENQDRTEVTPEFILAKYPGQVNPLPKPARRSSQTAVHSGNDGAVASTSRTVTALATPLASRKIPPPVAPKTSAAALAAREQILAARGARQLTAHNASFLYKSSAEASPRRLVRTASAAADSRPPHTTSVATDKVRLFGCEVEKKDIDKMSDAEVSALLQANAASAALAATDRAAAAPKGLGAKIARMFGRKKDEANDEKQRDAQSSTFFV